MIVWIVDRFQPCVEHHFLLVVTITVIMFDLLKFILFDSKLQTNIMPVDKFNENKVLQISLGEGGR